MDTLFTILLCVLFVLIVFRYAIRTLSYLEDYREKVKNRLSERFKR